MIQDPAILANILIVLFFALCMVLVYLAGRRAGRAIKHRMAIRRRMDEPETYGEEGGHPAIYNVAPCKPDAPEIGSGMLAGDGTRGAG